MVMPLVSSSCAMAGVAAAKKARAERPRMDLRMGFPLKIKKCDRPNLRLQTIASLLSHLLVVERLG
jgi:hypothetical protein